MLYLATKLGDITIEEILSMGFPILIGLGIVSAIFYAVVVSKQNAINDSQPKQTAMATVVSKQDVPANTFAGSILIMFETTDGRRVQLTCDIRSTIMVGDKGRLSWQGTRMLGFTRTSELGKASSGGQNIRAALTGEWKCACGRINQSYVSTCSCGKGKHDLENELPEKLPEQEKVKPENQSEGEKDKVAVIKEYKELMDTGIITPEEFEAKKKQLLGL